MKLKKNRALFLGLISTAAILAPASVSATLLIGFHDFTAGSGADNSPVTAIAGFSGAVNKTAAGLATGGSNSATYGDGVTPVSNISGGDGAVRLSLGSATFTITNNSLAKYTLETLYFDAAYLTGSTLDHTVNLTYSIGDEDFETLGSYNTTNAVAAAPLGTYGKFSAFIGLVLGVGESITFQFESDSARIDNIALTGDLTPVPEPGSLLALGGLLATGFCLRSRRCR